MLNLRNLGTAAAVAGAVLLSGCCSVSMGKSKKCAECGPVYPAPQAYESYPATGEHGVPLMTPAPVPVPTPTSIPPVPAVPPPPGAASRPSMIQGIRATTTDMFRSAGDNTRALFRR